MLERKNNHVATNNPKPLTLLATSDFGKKMRYVLAGMAIGVIAPDITDNAMAQKPATISEEVEEEPTQSRSDVFTTLEQWDEGNEVRKAERLLTDTIPLLESDVWLVRNRAEQSILRCVQNIQRVRNPIPTKLRNILLRFHPIVHEEKNMLDTQRSIEWIVGQTLDADDIPRYPPIKNLIRKHFSMLEEQHQLDITMDDDLNDALDKVVTTPKGCSGMEMLAFLCNKMNARVYRNPYKPYACHLESRPDGWGPMIAEGDLFGIHFPSANEEQYNVFTDPSRAAILGLRRGTTMPANRIFSYIHYPGWETSFQTRGEIRSVKDYENKFGSTIWCVEGRKPATAKVGLDQSEIECGYMNITAEKKKLGNKWAIVLHATTPNSLFEYGTGIDAGEGSFGHSLVHANQYTVTSNNDNNIKYKLQKLQAVDSNSNTLAVTLLMDEEPSSLCVRYFKEVHEQPYKKFVSKMCKPLIEY